MIKKLLDKFLKQTPRLPTTDDNVQVDGIYTCDKTWGDPNTVPDDGIVKELEPNDWMDVIDIINRLDGGKVQCHACHKFIRKEDSHINWNRCIDADQCRKNQEAPIVLQE